MITMDELSLVRVHYKYQMWMFRITAVYYPKEDKFLEYSREDVTNCQYNILSDNYLFLKRNTKQKSELLKHKRIVIKLLISTVRSEGFKKNDADT